MVTLSVQALCDHAFALNAVVPNGQRVGLPRTSFSFAEHGRQARMETYSSRPGVDLPQLPHRGARSGVIAHSEVPGIISDLRRMCGHRGCVVVDEVREIIEIHIAYA
jgi:hypothetical protein